MTLPTNRPAPARPVLVEACVDSVESAIAAQRGGAGRIELCDALFDGGTTPSAGMISACRGAVTIPLVVIIRPRGGGFVYSAPELDVMKRDIEIAGMLGVDGIVIGALRSDGTVDEGSTANLVEAAGGLELTFHRAFDLVPSQRSALETLAGLGITRVLTSGGAPSARDGVVRIASLVRQARRRIAVMAGGGIREENVREIVDATGVTEIHVRGTRLTRGGAGTLPRSIRIRKPLPDDEAVWEETDEKRIRRIVTLARA